jgi:dienelactone hydrolase
MQQYEREGESVDLPFDLLGDFRVETFSFDGISRDVYRIGDGQGIVLVHEIPGITPEVARLARLLAKQGYSVLMPRLFGRPGKPISPRYLLESFARVCIAGEFDALASRRSGPIVDWLRALCRAAHAELGGPGVGVIGMCFTGNFAIALMADESVIAPITSQPSLPLGRPSELHVSPEHLAQIRARKDVKLLGLRFTGDPLCPAGRFRRLRDELGDRFEAVEIDSSRFSLRHSVLTLHFVDEAGHPTRAAMDRVLSFLHERLRA